jgi:uncharacterized DUF497 family protein
MADSIDICWKGWYLFMDIVNGDFIWNSHKERANVLKHGVDFYAAIDVFSDPERLVFEDVQHSLVEVRYYCVGEVEGRIITVRFVYREGKIRIIGAGYWRKGRQYYEKEKNR